MALWPIILIVAIVAVLLLWFVGLYNKFVRLENRIDNSWAQIEVQLQRRGELIPNLINTVKGYAAHEKGVFQAVSDARAAMIGAKTPAAKMAADGVLEQALGKLFAIAEAYPDLKANTNFLQLQDELTHTENKISFARQHFNDSVLSFNNAIEVFPANLVANMFGKGTPKEMLEAPAAVRDVPKVEF